MFIGGSPGSTAGGVKTTTVFVLLLNVWAHLKQTKGCNIFGRRLQDDAVNKAGIVFSINLLLATCSSVALLALQDFRMEDVLFEVFSAIGTVGMTTGITRELCTVSRVIIIFLMYLGRVGSLTFALSFTERKKTDPLQRPAEKILIG
jgi:trk system potassium uptake protein TrkH